jgi:succinate-semialdehyde dehydrogenase/glutarate-semialdehyde dehydrogenase
MLTTTNPATGEAIQSYEQFSDQQVDETIRACHAAFLKWKTLSYAERGEHLQNLAQTLRDHKDELMETMTREMGKLHRQGRQEIELCAGICEYTAQSAPELLQDEERELPNGGNGLITYSPIGVVYGIQPWNFPAYQVIRYAVASLMAGNGVLLKHAENVTGSALLLEKLFQKAGLPADIFKVLLIDHDQSDKVIEHELVRGVTLTGSPGAGRVVAKKAGEALKKTVMELGSNDAYIVLSDADLDTAVKACVMGRVYNNGETCVAAKRFIVVDSMYEDFRDAFVAQMQSLTYGDPTNDDYQLGPMARKDLRDELHEQLQKSVQKGAKILCGGEMPDGPGYFYPATVLDNVKPGQPAYEEELFGPVASLIRAKDDEDALRIANDSRFGLGGGIFSKNPDRARQLARDHFDTGMVFINSFGLAQPNMPFGGVKDSGYGREHGGFGVREFVNAKAIMELA